MTQIRAVRLVHYTRLGAPPESVFGVPVTGMTVTSQTIVDDWKKTKKDSLVIVDFFDVDQDTFKIPGVAAKVINARTQERFQNDQHMATLFFWSALMLRKVKPFGILANPSPAPLSAEEIVLVFRQLALHPHYQHQTLVTTSQTHETVTMVDGVLSSDRLN